VPIKFNVFSSFFNFFFSFSKKTMADKVMGAELKQAAFQGNTDEILRLWRENGSTLDVEYRDIRGWAPLHWAALHGHEEACRALVSTCRADVDCPDVGGFTPLIATAAKNKPQCAEVLLELGADIARRDNNKNMTALEIAREKGHAEVAAFLEAAGRIPEIKSAHKV
jgi:ankyrin repeat protein